jgi:hypothetical protein
MAYPGTYNFNYYKGDTFEFKIYPKTSTGSVFDLTTYDSANGGNGAGFTIATARGSAGASSSPVTCVATISLSDNSITCRIRPTDGILLDASRTYVYDVQISKGSGTSATVFTLLTGSISVEDHVTGATA